MKGRVIAINEDGHSACLIDGHLEDIAMHDKNADRAPMPGEIWIARMDRQISGQNAAFVQMGKHQGYLRDLKGLKGIKSLPVQVAGAAEPGKAIPVERRILIKGRSLILTPGAPGTNVSRQIRDANERERLEGAIQPPEESCGIIVRSAAAELPEDVLQAELALLSNRLQALEAADDGAAIEISSPETHALREWTADWPDMIAVPDTLFKRLSHPDQLWMFGCDPALQEMLSPGDGDPFEHFGVWEALERLQQPEVDLPSGGSMFIEATRAMVTVDVNTGDQFGQGAGMTASVEAARELSRQLRLRGLGGQVIIDFAPIKKMHRKKIEEVLKAAFRKDSVPTTLAGWTPLGNFELQRKRERRPLTELM